MGRRSKGTLPQVRLHASSGQARVRIKGTEIWLGRYGSPEAQRRYDQLILQLVEERLGGLLAVLLLRQSPLPRPKRQAHEHAGQHQGGDPSTPQIRRCVCGVVWAADA